ncbi:hypothetical protein [Microbacterium sp. P02]|uniref:hypothetical protein n=1 Tax=unclassified Microbacterium TaxID=2609290 RepID=UPI00366CCC79
MPDILRWVVPAVVVFAVAAVLAAVAVWAVRRRRRSPRARAAAEAERARTGADLVALDDAIEEIDLELALSGALYGGGTPATLRRARMTAQHARDSAFDDYRSISDGDAQPAQVARAARVIRLRTGQALAVIARARAENDAWVRENLSASAQIAAASARLVDMRASMGDPVALVESLSDRFDEAEWAEARDAARAAVDAAASAEQHLTNARDAAADPSRSALTDLAGAERDLRRAMSETRMVEERHRLVMQAAAAVPGELAEARAAIRQAVTVREGLEPEDAERLGEAIRAADAALQALTPDATRRPTHTTDSLARLRDRLDMALGDARSAQQRLRGARTALPGTLAAARNAIAQAERALSQAHAGADARVRLADAQTDLAAARAGTDPVKALDEARRAVRKAEDAKALADHDRLARD